MSLVAELSTDGYQVLQMQSDFWRVIRGCTFVDVVRLGYSEAGAEVYEVGYGIRREGFQVAIALAKDLAARQC